MVINTSSVFRFIVLTNLWGLWHKQTRNTVIFNPVYFLMMHLGKMIRFYVYCMFFYVLRHFVFLWQTWIAQNEIFTCKFKGFLDMDRKLTRLEYRRVQFACTRILTHYSETLLAGIFKSHIKTSWRILVVSAYDVITMMSFRLPLFDFFLFTPVVYLTLWCLITSVLFNRPRQPVQQTTMPVLILFSFKCANAVGGTVRTV